MASKPKRGAKKPAGLTLAECTLLRKLCVTRIEKLKDCTKRAAGDLYPAIWAGEIQEVEALFLKLTGHPLD